MYIERVELCMLFEKLRTSNVQNYINYLMTNVH